MQSNLAEDAKLLLSKAKELEQAVWRGGMGGNDGEETVTKQPERTALFSLPQGNEEGQKVPGV